MLMHEGFGERLGLGKGQRGNARRRVRILVVDFPDFSGLELFDEAVGNPRLFNRIAG